METLRLGAINIDVNVRDPEEMTVCINPADAAFASPFRHSEVIAQATGVSTLRVAS